MEYWQPKIEKLKRKQLDELTVRVEVTKAAFGDKLADLMKLEKKIGYELQKVLNLSTRVELVETSTLPRSQGKSQKVIDKRKV